MTKLVKLELDPVGGHSALAPDDLCYYIGDYTPRAGYAHSEMNKRIINLKKDPSRRDKDEWQYKEKAIRESARLLTSAFSDYPLERCIFIPIPPSKNRDDPMYDDRLMQILNRVIGIEESQIIEAINVRSSTDAVHLSSGRRATVEAIKQNYILDHLNFTEKPKVVWLFDDVIASGAHFKAAKQLLMTVPSLETIPIVGLFIARSILEPQAQ